MCLRSQEVPAVHHDPILLVRRKSALILLDFHVGGLFGNLNLRFVGHAPEALDRVIIEGDVSKMEFISYYTEERPLKLEALQCLAISQRCKSIESLYLYY